MEIGFLSSSKNYSKNIAMAIRETAREWFRNAFDFLFDFFDEILIVLLIFIFERCSPGSPSGSLLLFLEELLAGASHWPYNEDNLY